MFAKFRPRSAYDVMAALALFIAISTGGAYAANTVFSTDIVDGEVKTPDLANAGVTNGKLAPNSVNTGKVADNNLTATDIANSGSLGPPEIGGLGSVDIADNTLTGTDINEGSLGTVTSSVLGGLGVQGRRQNGDPGPGSCDPEDSGYINCDMVAEIDLPRPARVLVIGSIRALPDPSAPPVEGTGACRLGTTSGPIPGTEVVVSVKDTPEGPSVDSEHLSMAGVTGVLGAGQHAVGVDCTEGWNRLIRFDYASVTAVALSDR